MQHPNLNMRSHSQYFLKQHLSLFPFFRVLFLLFTVTALPLVFAACDTNTTTGQSNGSGQNGEPGAHGNKALLINNWVITPAGKQIPLGEWPANTVLSPDGRSLLISNIGAGIQALQVVSTEDGNVIQTIPYTAPDSVFIGLAYSPDGRHAYAVGGGSDVVHTYDVAPSGQVTKAGDIVIGTKKANPFPTGLSISPDGAKLYVVNNLANNVAIIDTVTKKITGTVAIGHYPYTTLVSKDGKTVYASNWGDATISVIDASSQKVTATMKVGNHPCAMTFGPEGLLFVADANSDAVSVINTTTNQVVRTISVAPENNTPLSSSPEGVAVSRQVSLCRQLRQ